MDIMKRATSDRSSVVSEVWTTALVAFVVLLSVFSLSIGTAEGLIGTLALFAAAVPALIILVLAVASTLEVLLTARRHERTRTVLSSFRVASVAAASASAISVPVLFLALKDDQLAGFVGPYFMVAAAIFTLCASVVGYLIVRWRSRLT